MKNVRLAALLLLTLSTSCTSGLGGIETEEPAEAASTEPGMGIDFGVTLAEPVEGELALAGATIPGAGEEEDRRVVFAAFATRSAADNADAGGAALVRDTVPPSDTNGDFDVYLVAFEDDSITLEDGASQPASFSRALVDTFRHSRCVNCHGMGSVTPVGQEEVFPDSHPGPAAPVEVKTCNTCHSPDNVPGISGIEWRAPLDDDGEFDLRGLSVEELATRAMSFDLDEHLRNDGRVRWAFEVANVPFVLPQAGGNAGTSPQWSGSGRDRGQIPISYATFISQIDAWELAGFPVTASDAIADLVLVSQVPGGGSSGNAASSEPSITWIPNPAYTPGNSSVPAGSVRIAFASEASDLVPASVSAKDVYVTTFEFFVGQDPSDGSVAEGGLNLEWVDGSTQLVSRTGGGTGGDADSDQPDIDANGEHIAFRSGASDLVAGFSDGNAEAADVFLRDLTNDTTYLVSVSAGQAGGDGASGNPSVSPLGAIVAFESLASDLVASDQNGEQDIFFTRLDSGLLEPLERASVDSEGGEGSGGDCSNPQVAFVAERLSIVFESRKDNLVQAETDSFAQVYLREGDSTWLLSQVLLNQSLAGNGDSTLPTLDPTGAYVVYQSEADNLYDVEDSNGAADIFFIDLTRLRANQVVQPRRITLDSFLRSTDGPSTTPSVGAYREASGSFLTDGFTLFRSSATNIGVGRSGDLVALFLDRSDAVITDFSGDVLIGPAPLTVTFTDLSTDEPNTWAWDFGDPGSGPDNLSSEQNPAHTYTTPGSFDVSLQVTRPGGSEVVEKLAYVRALEPLTVDFSGDDLTGPVPHTVNFTSLLTGDLDGAVYSWDFGDGTMSEEENPTHVFMTEGSYSVTLQVTGLSGQDMEMKADYVTAIPASGANFTFDTSGGLRVAFSDASEGGPTTWEWRVDGSLFSTNQNPQFDFEDNGTYSVSLNIDGPGGPSSETKQVIVDAVPFSAVYPGFASCFGCHGNNGGLDLATSEAMAFAELLGAGTGAPAEGGCCGGEVRVVPFDADNSLLFKVADPGVTACNSPALCGSGANMGTVTDLSLLEMWINEGAAEGAP